MRAISIIVAILGLASLVFGVLFIVQAGSADKTLAEELKPLMTSEVNAKYDAVTPKQRGIMAQEEPKIQAGQAAPSAMYNYLTVQRTALGLARANIGMIQFVRTSGVIDIIVGLGLILAGYALMKKAPAA